MTELNKIESDIAVIGMAGRFPGADTLTQFWSNLKNSVESVQFFSQDELTSSYIDSASIDHPDYIKARGILNNVDKFDASFFNINPREAAIMDPQHRLFLECAAEALENSGYVPTSFEGAISVIAGSYHNTYLLNNLYSNPSLLELVGGDVIMHGNAHDHLATHVSYKLNLTGPSFTVQTACSSSLVAIHLACQQLLNGESDMVLAGGVCINIPEKSGYLYQQGGIFSADGHCRAFDAEASGTVFGNGLGIVVLRRLTDALLAGDHIHAVIKGSAANNDGSAKVGYMAPSIEGQTAVITESLAISEVDPASVRYIEAHGTGTIIGDAIEIAALTAAYSQYTTQKNFCAIGSVKTNIGHLNAASGVAGLIKTILSIQNKTLPASLHFDTPGANLNLAESPFYINQQCREWPADSFPRRAGLSSFGVGGTNVHLILEEAPACHFSRSQKSQLLILSAKTLSALDQMTVNLIDYLKSPETKLLADVAFTLQVGRDNFEYRRIIVCPERNDLLPHLQTSEFTDHQSKTNEKKIVFMFSGQGSQYANMTLGLYQHLPEFRRHVDACSEQLREHLGVDIRTLLYPATESQLEEAKQILNQTAFAQPVLFVIEYALAKVWMDWGIVPTCMIGHSLGEYVAACIAGVFSLNDALALVTVRGKLMQELPGGAMLSVGLSAEATSPYIAGTSLCIAAINTRAACVVSGDYTAIEQLQAQLSAQSISHQVLHTSHAFHSKMMDDMLEKFQDYISRITRWSPKIPYISNLTGKFISDAEVISSTYWVNHLRQAVLFADGLTQIFEQTNVDTNLIFLEIGPSNALSIFAESAHTSIAHSVFASIRHPKNQENDYSFILSTLGKLWLQGLTINWQKVHGEEKRLRIPLPTYPFERKSHWIEPKPTSTTDASIHPLGKKPNKLDWFYLPSWKQTALPLEYDIFSKTYNWLVFQDEHGLGEEIIQHLIANKQQVTRVIAGEEWKIIDSQSLVINPDLSNDYCTLMDKLYQENICPNKILYFQSLTSNIVIKAQNIDKIQYEDFNRLINLAQALGKKSTNSVQLDLYVITNNMQEVVGGDLLHPEKAVVVGPCRAIGQEYPNIKCLSIDISLPVSIQLTKKLINQLMLEFTSIQSAAIVAYRDKHRWVQTFEPWKIKPMGDEISVLRQHGVYLITGGLGGIGLSLASYLAQACQATLILTTRTDFPEKQYWPTWHKQNEAHNKTSQAIKQLLAMEASGATIIVLRADVTNENEMQIALDYVHKQFGSIHGVIHAAGVAGGSLIQTKSAASSANVLKTKIQGALNLYKILNGVKLDFLLFCSSINSILSAVGQADYCAANAFLDAYAHYVTTTTGIFTVSVNWDTWQEVGMAVNTSVPKAMQNLRDESLKQGILPVEGQELFRYILAAKVPQIIISTQALPAVIKQHQEITLAVLEGYPVVNINTQLQHKRPNLNVAFVAPQNEIEIKITEIWEELLGIRGIGSEDNFFDLGGHSLLASQVLARLRESFGTEVSLDTVFKMPTVSELAMVVEDQILEEIESQALND